MEYRAVETKSVVRREKNLATTVRLPESLLEHAKAAIESGLTGVATLSGLIAGALESYLQNLQREQVDQAFLRIGGDAKYLELSRNVNDSFARTDWESLPTRIAHGSHSARQEATTLEKHSS